MNTLRFWLHLVSCLAFAAWMGWLVAGVLNTLEEGLGAITISEKPIDGDS